MDKVKAKEIEKELKGKSFVGYTVINFIDNGKSSAVFKVKKNNNFFALKIFDNSLVEAIGHEVQIDRIEKEISLKGHNYKNLVKIYDGGKESISGKEYYYIVMEYIDGMNLGQYIKEKTYNQDFILNVFKRLYNLSEELLENNIVHRDIKPENIMITAQKRVVLLDLSVLKMVGETSLTDLDGKYFLGTIRYAPPEFLLREEKDDAKAWRAINLYQIGGVLHDLIMKNTLFYNKEPKAKLIFAIKEEMPLLNNSEYDYRLNQIAIDMLLKDPIRREELCSKDRIYNFFIKIKTPEPSYFDELNKLKIQNQKRVSLKEEIDNLQRNFKQKKEEREKIYKRILEIINDSFENIVNEKLCSTCSVSENFNYQDGGYENDYAVNNKMYILSGDITMGYLRDIMIIFKIINNEYGYCEIMMAGILPSNFLKYDMKDSPIDIIKSIKRESGGTVVNRSTIKRKSVTNLKPIILPFTDVFKGVICGDNQLEDIITSKIIRLLSRMLSQWDSSINSMMINNKNALMNNGSRISDRSSPIRTLLVSYDS